MRIFRFTAGMAVGYVLGTRAGREKYDQIVASARRFAGQPAVVDAQAKVKGMVDAGTQAVTAKVGDVADTLTEKVTPTRAKSSTVASTAGFVAEPAAPRSIS